MLTQKSATLSLADLVPEWQDEERISALYAPLPSQRAINEHAWDDKFSFWSRAIPLVLQKLGKLGATAETIKQIFNRGGLVPMCIEQVLTEMHKQKKVQSREEIRKSAPASSWGSAIWTTTSYLLWGASEQKIDPKQEMIFLEPLRQISNGLLHKLRAELCVFPSDSVIPFHQLKKFAPTLKNEDLELVADMWEAERAAVVFHTEKSDQHTAAIKGIKISHEGRSVAVDPETDSGVLKLKCALERVDLVVEHFKEQIEKAHKEAVVAVKQKQKASAVRALKRQRQYDDALRGKLEMQNTLTDILFKIQSAENTREVFEAMKVAPKVLRAQTAQVNLSELDDVIVTIEDAQADLKQIDDTMAQAAGALSSADESDLEAELAQLVEEEEKAKKAPPVAVALKPAPPVAGESAVTAKPRAPVAKQNNHIAVPSSSSSLDAQLREAEAESDALWRRLEALTVSSAKPTASVATQKTASGSGKGAVKQPVYDS